MIPYLELLIWAVVMAMTIWGTRLAIHRKRQGPPHLDAPFGLFPVTILKPLKGVDEDLERNLEGFFKLDYPEYEIRFCVASAADPAIHVARRLIARYPEVKARLCVGETVVGPNPKVNNLIQAYELARHDWVLISDSNVRVRPDYLKRLVAHLTPSVGLVTAVVTGHEARGVGAQLEAAYLNTFYTRGMNIAASVGRPCVVGKCMLFRRSVAKRFGGLRTLGKYLAEDYMAGEAMRRLGLEVVIASDAVEQVIGDYSVQAFWKRHLRWGRIRKRHGFGAFLFEPLTGALCSGVLGALALERLVGLEMSTFWLAHLGTWALCELLMMRALRVPLRWSTPLAWFARELLALPLWLHVASGNTVEWRGRRLALGAGGILQTSPSS